MVMRITILSSNLLALILLAPAVLAMDLIAVKFIEKNGSILVATSNSNYALASPGLANRNWRVVSVNGDSVLITTTANEKLQESFSQLSQEDRSLLQSLRDETSLGNNGYTHVSSGLGASNYVMSSDTSSSSSSSTSVSASTGLSSDREQSINVRDENNFSVARSDLPLNWSRVFFVRDLIAMVYRSGEVRMMPFNLLDPEELSAATRVREDVKEMQKKHAQEISSTMKHSLDMVSNVFNNIMGRFPKPPSYENAVGNMFGNNFPFGPNNSPFTSSAGWPFSGNGAFAYANAGRR